MAKAIHMMIRVLDETKSVDFTARRSASRSPTGSRLTISRWSTCVRQRRISRWNSPSITGGQNPIPMGRLWPSRRLGRQCRCGAPAARGAWAVARGDEGISSRRRADGKIFLPPGPGRVQNRSTAATRPIRIALSGAKDPACHREELMTEIGNHAGLSPADDAQTAGIRLIVAAITPAGHDPRRTAMPGHATAETLQPDDVRRTLVQMTRGSSTRRRGSATNYYAAAVSVLDADCQGRRRREEVA